MDHALGWIEDYVRGVWVCASECESLRGSHPWASEDKKRGSNEPPRICHRLKNVPWFQVLSKGDGLVLFTFYENFFQSTYFQVVSKLLVFAFPGFHICSHFSSCRGEGLLYKVQQEETITITLQVHFILNSHSANIYESCFGRCKRILSTESLLCI